MILRDDVGNKYYPEKDCLYMDVALTGEKRFVGRLTENISTHQLKLVIQRNRDEEASIGFLIPAAPLDTGRITDIVMVLDGTELYRVEWALHRDKAWVFNAVSHELGRVYGKHYAIPLRKWDFIGSTNKLILTPS